MNPKPETLNPTPKPLTPTPLTPTPEPLAPTPELLNPCSPLTPKPAIPKWRTPKPLTPEPEIPKRQAGTQHRVVVEESKIAGEVSALIKGEVATNPAPCTLHPAPFNPHPTPHTLHPAPYTLHSKEGEGLRVGCSGHIGCNLRCYFGETEEGGVRGEGGVGTAQGRGSPSPHSF